MQSISKIQEQFNRVIQYSQDIDNPKTGEFSIFLIVSLTILAIGGTIYYFKRIRNDKNINF